MDNSGDLLRLENLFDGFFDWLAGQYDRETGGFYYARSSIENDRFKPDIESTAQAVSILERNNLVKDMPKTIREKLISFFQNKQDATSGYFYDENPAMKKDEVMVSRAMNYAKNSLRRLGSKPLYPDPIAMTKAPDYTQSIETYREKWENISLVHSWRGCDLLSSSTTYINQLPKDIRKQYIQEAVNYFSSIQDPETGLWGEGTLYNRISGTFKMHTFFRKYNIPLPLEDRIYQSILHCLRTEAAEDMCYIRNPIHLLSYLTIDLPKEDLKEIIQITIDNLEKLKRTDGGFSREIGNSPKAPNIAQVKADEYYPDMPEAVELSEGRYEGDMNASTQAVLIRLLIYQLLDQEVKPLKGSENFYPLLQKRLNYQREV